MSRTTRPMQIATWSLVTTAAICPVEQGLSFTHLGTTSALPSSKLESGNPEVGL